MPELTEGGLNIIAIVLLSLGALMSFLGYRLFLLFLALGGFVAVGAVAAGGGLLISQDLTVGVIAGVLGGFIGAVLMVLLYYAVLFTSGAVTAGLIGYVICVYGSIPFTTITVSAVACAALLGGVLALFLQRFVIVMVTSLKGAGFLTAGLFYMIRRATLNPLLLAAYAEALKQAGEKGPAETLRQGIQLPAETLNGLAGVFDTTSFYLMLLGAVALTLLGVAIQYTVTARPKAKAPAPEKPQA